MDKKKIALIVVVLFLLIGLGSFVFANPDQDNSLEGPGVSEDGGSGDGEAIDGTTPTATPTEEGNGQTTLGTNPVTTIGNGGTGTGTNGSDSTEVTGGIGNTEMSAYEDAAKIVAELENKVASMTNRDESNAAIDYRTDTDIMNIVNGLPDGEEKDQLLDRLAAINKVLDDTTPPEISGISNGDVTKENVTINVTDDNDVVITATLDGEAIDFTTPLTEEGKYVVIVTDKNFNESKVEFTIDKHAPTRQVLRLTNVSQKDAEGNWLQYAKAGDTVRVIVQFNEELATLPTLKVNGVEVGQMKYDSNMSSYTFDYHVTENDVNGIMQIEISNYADAAGNVGGVLTNAEINHDTQNQMIIDTVAPVLNFNNGFITDGFTVVATDDNFDYMTIQFYDGREMVTTNENTFTLDKDGDNTRYNIKAYDKAGNVSAYADIYLDTQKPVITGTGKNGKNDVNVANNGYYKNVTLHIEDGSMKKVVLVHSDNTEEVLQEYKDNYTTDKMIFDREFTEDGTYTIKAVDRFGHESTITFTIDTVKPVITGIENGTFTNQDVTLNVTDENPGGTIHLKRDGQIVKNYSFGTPLTEEGTYEVYVSDLAGNVSDTLTFTIDKTVPTITVKEESVGSFEKNIFSKVSFKLYDEYGVVAYRINEGDYKTFTVSPWSDANYENIDDQLVYGTNAITLKDVAGNEATYEFTYDNQDPTITVKEESVGSFEKNIFSKVSFKLYDEYGVVAYRINEGDYKTFTVSPWSDANYENIDDQLVYGTNTITLKDVAGNEATYEFTYDNQDPTITVKEESVGSFEKNIFSKVSFKLYDEYGVVAYRINEGDYKTFTVSPWSDANYENIDDQLVYGTNTITLKDVAGNEATYEFTYDIYNIDNEDLIVTVLKSNNDKSTNQNVVVTLVGNKTISAEGWNQVSANEISKEYDEVGKYTVVVTDENGNQQTVNFEVKRIDKVAPSATVTKSNNDKSTNQDVTVTIVTDEAIYKPEGWTEVTTNKEHEFTKVYSENGKYSVEITDKAGNKSTINFEVKRIDKVAPTAVVTTSNNNGLWNTNQDVTVTIVADEAIYKPEGWTEVTTNKEHEFTKVYSENGKYSVEITDKAGNKSTINFEVKRIDKVAPVMTVTSPNRYEIEQGSTYVDKGYSAWDAVDKDVTNLIKISYRFIAAGTGNYVEVPELDTNKIGQYVVTYTAYDKAGNSSQSTRVVEIVPKTEG